MGSWWGTPTLHILVKILTPCVTPHRGNILPGVIQSTPPPPGKAINKPGIVCMVRAGGPGPFQSGPNPDKTFSRDHRKSLPHRLLSPRIPSPAAFGAGTGAPGGAGEGCGRTLSPTRRKGKEGWVVNGQLIPPPPTPTLTWAEGGP